MNLATMLEIYAGGCKCPDKPGRRGPCPCGEKDCPGCSDGSATIPPSEFPLTPAQQRVEAKFARWIMQDVERAKRVYRKQFGNVLNADNAKELSLDYRKDRTEYALAVHEPASWLTKEMYKDVLKARVAPGKDNVILFTAGGAGSGKTTGIQDALTGNGNPLDTAHAIYDGTLRPAKKAGGRIRQALDAGKHVEVKFVHRDPVDAFVNGVVPRAQRMGRTVPIAEMAKQYASIDLSMRELKTRFGSDKRFSLDVIDNSRGKGKAIISTLDRLPKSRSEAQILSGLRRALEKAYRSKTISKKLYVAFKAGSGSKEVGI